MRDLDAYRPEFPALARQIYLNHASVAPTSTRVRNAVVEWVDDLVANGVLNEQTWEARAEAARASCATLIGATPGEIAFVRNTSHGLGLIAEGLDWKEGDEVAVCAEIEYPSNVYPWRHLKDRGVSVREIRPVRGGVVPDAVAAALTPRTKLVAVSSVQYASGHRTDLTAIGRLCRSKGVLLCVDGIQSVGALPLDVAKAGIDFLSADSHKWMLGVNGSGFLYVSRAAAARVRPVLVGWHSTTGAWNFDRAVFELRTDAQRFEEGSPSYLSVWSLGTAVDLLLEVGVERIAARIGELLARLERGLAAAGCDVSPGPEDRAGILTFVPPAPANVAAVAAHLAANRVSVTVRRGRIRVSPHFYTTDAEMDEVIRLVRDAIRA
jgi:selenocysteine lyase/cysteine desulfurase